MTSRKLAAQLDSLKSIKPRTEWTARTRDILLSQITAQGVEQPQPIKAFSVGSVGAYLRGATIAVYRQTFEQLFARPLVLSGTLSVFVVMVVSAVVAAKGSMPGDPLYTVKRTGEQIHVTFVSPSERPGLQLDFANTRIEELSALSNRSLSEGERTKQAERLVTEANASIVSAKEDLLRLTKETPEKAAEVATEVRRQVIQSEERVTDVSAGNDKDTAGVADVIANLDDTKGAALSVIVDKKESANIPDESVKAHLDEAIGELEERLARLQNVSAAGFREGEGDDKSQEVKEELRAARESLERKDYKIALQSITRSRGIIALAEHELRRAPMEDADTGEQQDRKQ